MRPVGEEAPVDLKKLAQAAKAKAAAAAAAAAAIVARPLAKANASTKPVETAAKGAPPAQAQANAQPCAILSEQWPTLSVKEVQRM